MFTTNSAFKFRTNRATLVYSHFYQLTYTILVKYLEWINLQYFLIEIYRQETGNVIA